MSTADKSDSTISTDKTGPAGDPGSADDLLALAEQIAGGGSHVLEHTKATGIETDGDKQRLSTDHGTITTKDIVIATHEPFHDPGKEYADMTKFRDFALGILIKEDTPPGEFFSTGEEPHSIRVQATEDGDIIIIGGKSKDEMAAKNDEEAYELVEKDYSKKFSIERVVYKWNTYDLATTDGASYIGRLAEDDPHVLVATGFNGWGMTNGVLAGLLIGDRITGKENPWADFFDKFSRKQYQR